MSDTLRVLACDKVSPTGLDLLRPFVEVIEAGELAEDALIAALEGVQGLIVRSGTRVTERVFENAPALKVVARAGVGIDNIDVKAATKHGVIIVNSPAGNIIAAAEHTVALMLSAARNIPQANISMKAGEFERKAFMGRQVAGKTLGIIGLGNIGTEVARRCRGLDMKLMVFDPYAPEGHIEKIGAVTATLDEVLASADFITVHTPLTDETRGLIGAAEFDKMQPHVVLINCARGGIIDEQELLNALNANKLACAAIDVWVGEPNPRQDLVAHPKLIATPHLGASTTEAQEMVAVDAASQILDVLSGRPPHSPVNITRIPPELAAELTPFVILANDLGRLARVLTGAHPREVAVRATPAVPLQGLPLLATRVLSELLHGTSDTHVNDVNAMAIARERGIEMSHAVIGEDCGYSRWLEVTVKFGDKSCTVAGAVLEGGQPRILRVDIFAVDAIPEGEYLLVWKRNPQVPGFIGAVGTILAEAKIGISSAIAGREEHDAVGLLMARVQAPVSEAIQEKILALVDVERLETVSFDE